MGHGPAFLLSTAGSGGIRWDEGPERISRNGVCNGEASGSADRLMRNYGCADAFGKGESI